ncbi:MAG: DUF1428 domain-containing protein [Sphingomonadales bacterium]|nr:MAG: DUF1428 domain-containing protein [Sphingomonadales bacterium]
MDGYVLPVPTAKREAYHELAARMAPIFQTHGALRVVEAWADDTPDGAVTDYNRATHKQADESVVYAWIEWPDKAARDAAWGAIMADEGNREPEPPFDGQRMMWGGFAPILDTARS